MSATNTAKTSVLLVDDEESMREMLSIALEKDGHIVDTAPNGMTAVEMAGECEYDVVLQDLKMPGMDGIELLSKLREITPNTPVIIMTAFSTWDRAVEAMRLGAHDYIKKPFDTNDIRDRLRRAISVKRLREDPNAVENPEICCTSIIGSSPEINEILGIIRQIASSDGTVVIQGESGTGKEMVARSLHMESYRRQGPFIAVNCGAFSETLLESEIFGHKKGSFTGAIADKKGLLEIANGGTFFLDEVGEMSLHTQVRLLRVLETREFIPVGGTTPVKTDVRFVAATNRDLEAMVEEQTFREDLFYRLNVIPMYLPPLRERKEDIPLLAGHFLANYSHRSGKNITGFSAEAMEDLMKYDWPGNVRELQNTVQRAIALGSGPEVDANSIMPPRHSSQACRSDITTEQEEIPDDGIDLDEMLAAVEKRYIKKALDKTGGNLTQAAQLLGITFRSIRYKVKKLKIEI